MQGDGFLNNQKTATVELNRSVEVTDTCLFTSDEQHKQDEQVC